MRRNRLPLCALLAFSLVLLAVAPATSQAAANKYLVTFAARSCPTYASITANLARNNIQESLQDLGADTLYSAGQPIAPAVEDAGQPDCTPITNWRFVLGTGIITHGSIGPWGALSTVKGAFDTAIQTQAETPLLSVTGAPTGQNIAGATTIQLTDQQAGLAASPNNFWVQGGLVNDPVMNGAFPSTYGFGALRCSVDNLNGDNVEWIAFPSGTTHVFCYAYYVKPPPTAGAIIVRKEVVGADAYKNDFAFHGNISYDPNGFFGLTASPGSAGQTTFYRSETNSPDSVWSFSEDPQPNWSLDSLTCVSKNGTSSSSVDLAKAAASVHLSALDTVTCTYVDRFTPPPAGLSITKTTLGGVGLFDYVVSHSGGAVAGRASARTTAESETVSAHPSLSLKAGKYKIDEQSPVSSAGKWHTVSVYCNGERITKPSNVLVDLASGKGTVCDYTNAFVPRGSLSLAKKTLGAVGTTGFVISNVKHPSLQFQQHATTTNEGVAAPAKGDDTSHLPLGEYVIQETTPTGGTDGGWALIDVQCGNEVIPFDQGRALVTLTKSDPNRDCTFVNRFESGGTVSPEGGGEDPNANLKVTKTAVTPTVPLGGTLVFKIRVQNTAGHEAQNVYATEQRISHASFISVSPSRYSCERLPAPSCRIGNLGPHQSVTLTVRVLATKTGLFTNTVAIGTSTAEASVADNRSTARVRVTAAPPHFPGGLG